jgi:hypothetical protein
LLLHCFYDLPATHDRSSGPTFLPLPGGPPAYHGGWQQLADSLAAEQHDFDLVVCASLDRISRRGTQLRERAAILTLHRIRLVSVMPDWRETGQALVELTAAPTVLKGTTSPWGIGGYGRPNGDR